MKFRSFMLCLWLGSAASLFAQDKPVFRPNIGLETNVSVFTPWYKQREGAEIMFRYSFAPGTLANVYHRSALRLSIHQFSKIYYSSTYTHSDTDQFIASSMWLYGQQWQVALGYEQQLFFFNNRLRLSVGLDILGKHAEGNNYRYGSELLKKLKTNTVNTTSGQITIREYGLRPNIGLAIFPTRWCSIGIEGSWLRYSGINRISSKFNNNPRTTFTSKTSGSDSSPFRFVYIGIHF